MIPTAGNSLSFRARTAPNPTSVFSGGFLFMASLVANRPREFVSFTSEFSSLQGSPQIPVLVLVPVGFQALCLPPSANTRERKPGAIYGHCVQKPGT